MVTLLDAMVRASVALDFENYSFDFELWPCMSVSAVWVFGGSLECTDCGPLDISKRIVFSLAQYRFFLTSPVSLTMLAYDISM